MLECLIIGDSIAVGVGSVLPKCETIAKVGINSKNFFIHYKHIPTANKTIISLGSNDGNADFSQHLNKLRSSITSDVIWLLPIIDTKSKAVVLDIAKQNNDRVISLAQFKTNDGVHPNNYSTVVKKIF